MKQKKKKEKWMKPRHHVVTKVVSWGLWPYTRWKYNVKVEAVDNSNYWEVLTKNAKRVKIGEILEYLRQVVIKEPYKNLKEDLIKEIP